VLWDRLRFNTRNDWLTASLPKPGSAKLPRRSCETQEIRPQATEHFGFGGVGQAAIERRASRKGR
jgi:hypothetical protein